MNQSVAYTIQRRLENAQGGTTEDSLIELEGMKGCAVLLVPLWRSEAAALEDLLREHCHERRNSL